METVYEYVHFEAKVQSTVCKNKTRHFRIVYSIEDYVNLETGGISFKENFAEFAVLLSAACPEKKKNTFPLTVIAIGARCHPKRSQS